MAAPISGASTTRDRSRDTGLALVLILLIAHMATGRDGFTTAALVVLVVAMTVAAAVPARVSRLVRPLAPAGHGDVEGAARSGVLPDRHPRRRRPAAARLRLTASAGVQAQRRLGAAARATTSSWPATSRSPTEPHGIPARPLGVPQPAQEVLAAAGDRRARRVRRADRAHERVGDRTVHLHACSSGASGHSRHLGLLPRQRGRAAGRRRDCRRRAGRALLAQASRRVVPHQRLPLRARRGRRAGTTGWRGWPSTTSRS